MFAWKYWGGGPHLFNQQILIKCGMHASNYAEGDSGKKRSRTQIPPSKSFHASRYSKTQSQINQGLKSDYLSVHVKNYLHTECGACLRFSFSLSLSASLSLSQNKYINIFKLKYYLKMFKVNYETMLQYQDWFLLLNMIGYYE